MRRSKNTLEVEAETIQMILVVYKTNEDFQLFQWNEILWPVNWVVNIG